MKIKQLITTLMFLFTMIISAQQPENLARGALIDGKTFAKFNVAGVTINSYGGSLERIINKRISVAATLGTSNQIEVPFLSQVNARLGGSIEDVNLIKSIQISQFSISPEMRIYLGKGFGRGFYVSPYYRYETLKSENNEYPILDDESLEVLKIDGKINSNSFGLTLGYQFLLGKNKNIVIDFAPIGIHVGPASAEIDLLYTGELDQKARDKIQETINSNLELVPEYIQVHGGQIQSDNSAHFGLKGPWAFIRSSISVGIRF